MSVVFSSNYNVGYSRLIVFLQTDEAELLEFIIIPKEDQMGIFDRVSSTHTSKQDTDLDSVS